jgi:hypothetical protein
LEDDVRSAFSRIVVGLAFLLAPVAAFGQIQYYLPQFVDGNFGLVYKTSIILFNNSDTTVTATLKLTSDTGGPLSARFAGLGSGSQFNMTLAPGITRIYQSDGGGSGQGAATVTSTGPIGVSAVFTVSDSAGNFVSEAGVGASPSLTDFVLPVDSTGSALTGLALFNPGAADASLTLTLFSTDGSRAGTMDSALAKGGHTAAFVGLNFAGQFFPSIVNFRGTMRVQSSQPVSAVVLRQYQTSLTTCFTSLPVVPRSSGKTSLNLAHVASGSYGSISFRTSFLVFNLSSNSADITLALTDDNGSPLSVNIPGSGAGTGVGPNRRFTLEPNQSVFLQTDGAGAGASGAASITSTVPVGASAIFTVYNSRGFQTEAGVGDSTALSGLTLPVDITGLSDTGIAFFNPGGSEITLTFKLFDDAGVTKGTTTRAIAARGHLATFVDNVFVGTSGFRGSLAVSSTAGFASTVLRQYNYGANYTTLPAASGVVTGNAGPSTFMVAARALAQTGMAIGQASTVLQSQLQMVLARYMGSTSCAPLEGGGSVQSVGATVGVYYDLACRRPYVLATPSVTSNSNGVIDVSETATYYGLDGNVMGSMPLKETAVIPYDGADTLYGLGSFTPVSGARRTVQLGCFCVLSSDGTGRCAGGIAQDFPELGMALGAVTPMSIRFDPNSSRSPVTFTGGGTVVTGPIGSLTLSNPRPTTLVIQGGTDFATTVAGGGAATFSLFPPTPTSWTLADSSHDEQLQITVTDEATRNLSISITLISSGITIASGTLDQSGSGRITWSDGTSTPITNWTLTAQQ